MLKNENGANVCLFAKTLICWNFLDVKEKSEEKEFLLQMVISLVFN